MTKQDRSLTETAVTPRSRCLCGTYDLQRVPMTNSNLSASRWIHLDASLASRCSWCRHSEFIHTESGPCLFGECRCPRFFPMVESAAARRRRVRSSASGDGFMSAPPTPHDAPNVLPDDTRSTGSALCLRHAVEALGRREQSPSLRSRRSQPGCGHASLSSSTPSTRSPSIG